MYIVWVVEIQSLVYSLIELNDIFCVFVNHESFIKRQYN